jgi:N-acetylglutamate synthase/N-acetylornithine aminotransferase
MVNCKNKTPRCHISDSAEQRAKCKGSKVPRHQAQSSTCRDRNGVAAAPTDVEPDVSGATCTIELDLGIGSGSAGYLTSDLSYDYVRINADYRS